MKKKLIYLCLALLTIVIIACDPSNPNAIAKIEPVIVVGVCFTLMIGVLAFALIVEVKRPKWQHVYFWLMRQYQVTDNDVNTINGDQLRAQLSKKYKLSDKQAEECVCNLNNQDWFEKCEFLKG